MSRRSLGATGRAGAECYAAEVPVAEFEDKSFEAALNIQLLVETSQLYSPGQVLEAVLGFDVAMLTQHVSHWRLWNVQTPVGGVLTDAWGSADVTLPLSLLRDFKLNLFIQHKRPSVITHESAAEWASWSRAYYRYAISPPQQSALEQCAAALGKSGLVLYAAPAFWSLRDLCTFTASSSLVANTNFVEVVELSGRNIYTYVAEGTHGIAFGDPVEIKTMSGPNAFPDRIRGAAEIPPGSNIFKIADRALTTTVAAFPVLQEVSEQVSTRARDALGIIRQALTRGPEEKAVREIILPYFRVAAFSWLLGVDWLVGGIARRNLR